MSIISRGLSTAGFRALSEGSGRLFWRVFADGFIELLSGTGGESGPIENGNWGATRWGFQLFRGVYRPMGFGRYRRGVGIYSGFPPKGFIELLGAGG